LGKITTVRLAFLMLCSAMLARAAEPAAPTAPAPALTATEIPSPAGAGTFGPSLVTAPDGAVWMSWATRAMNGSSALLFSIFDRDAKRWSEPREIATGTDWFLNWADFPALSVGPNGHATAVWFVNNPAPVEPAPAAPQGHHGPGYRALISQTTDGGKTWSKPAPLTRESDAVEFVSLATLADGRVLAVWLDGRVKKIMAAHSAHVPNAPEPPMQLFARIVGADGPDVLLDASVCDCCQTALTAFLDGTALVAYRGRQPGEVRDIRSARFDGRAWKEPRTVNNDEWRIPGCPVNGPQLASDGGRVAIAWFTGAENNPRVLASFSPDAGGRFLMPLRLDSVKPLGRVDTLLLHDGAMLVSWVGGDGAVWLRRVSPEFSESITLQLAPPSAGRMKAVPRMALVRDYAGGKTSAEALVTFARGEEPGAATHLVTIPEGDLLEAEKSCDCAPTADQLQGFPIRATVVGSPAPGVLRVTHADLPGIFAAGTRDFRLATSVPAATTEPGRTLLGRIDRRDGAWWLSDIRLIATPQR
jgi:hypothetical protein